LGKSVNLSQA
jgi:hypothetical protein